MTDSSKKTKKIVDEILSHDHKKVLLDRNHIVYISIPSALIFYAHCPNMYIRKRSHPAISYHHNLAYDL